MKKVILILIVVAFSLWLVGFRAEFSRKLIETPSPTPTPTPTPEVYNWYFDGEKITGENPFLGGGEGLVEDYCGIGKGTTIVNYDGMTETDCVPK